MTILLDASLLREHCNVPPEALSPVRAARLVEKLGWLSPWWLPQSVLQRAAEHRPAYHGYTKRPALPSDPGGCWVIFTCPRNLASLRPAFALPLYWRAEHEDDLNLPGPMKTLADQVRGQVLGEGDVRWGLRLAMPEVAEARDLSGLDDNAMGVSSGWAALTGGLLLARDHGVPDRQVWVSAAWDERIGIDPVEGVSAKLTLAAEWGATQIFVPAQNKQEVAEWGIPNGHKLDVKLLAPVSEKPKLTRLLEPYLDQLGIEPAEDAPATARRAFYCRVGRHRADTFYWTHLLTDSIARCRNNVRSQFADCRPTHLVTVVGNQPSVVSLAPLALEVKHCLLMFEEPTDERKRKDKSYELIKTNLDKVRTLLAKHRVEAKAVGLRLGNRAEELRHLEAAIREFKAGVPAENLAFDLTPGYKSLSLELEELAPVESWLLYCRHELLEPDNRVDPGTERYDCWRRISGSELPR